MDKNVFQIAYRQEGDDHDYIVRYVSIHGKDDVVKTLLRDISYGHNGNPYLKTYIMSVKEI